jgi:hypothetical protein
MRRQRPNILALPLALLVLQTCSPSLPGDRDLDRALFSIQSDNVYESCRTLASIRFSGRLTGHEGYTEAARWAADRFREWKLKPLDEKTGYLRPYPSPYTIVDKAEMAMIMSRTENGSFQETVRPFETGKDFLPCFFSDNGRNTADVAFVGWGISAPDLAYDDYAGMDVRGKYVLCFKGSPRAGDLRFDDYNHLFHRVGNAVEKGALGLLIVAPEPQANPSALWKKGYSHAVIAEKTADAILRENGTTGAELRARLTATGKPLSMNLKARIRFAVASRHFPDGIGYNIAAYCEGSDPRLRQECVMIGAHLDACGLHMGFHYPGADDNASGCAVVLEAAKAFSKLARKPRRSVLFVLFGGEEMRIQGSEYFSREMLPPFTRTDGMINLDMVGEGDGLRGSYSPDTLEMKELFEKADAERKILRKMAPIEGMASVSDHLPFMRKGVTCVQISSNGPHFGYHQTGDTIYRINPEIMADCARLVFMGGFAWADR